MMEGAHHRPQPRADVDICICSYHRPEIVQTLAAIAAQRDIAQYDVRVVVADNSLKGECESLLIGAAKDLQLKFCYIHAPANNISIARNACLDAATAHWIAFLDDDELPEPTWLAALLSQAGQGGLDAVLGPVVAVYATSAPRWLREGSFHSTYPVRIGATILTGYTGNVLLRRSFIEKIALRFRTALGTTGGEDHDFFYRFTDAGGRIGYASEAIANEHVPPERANIRWLMRRNFRAGQSHGARLRGHKRTALEFCRASAKVMVCAAGAILNVASAPRRSRYLTRTALHFGVVARLAGFKEIRMY